MKAVKFLEGERCFLRPFSEEDILQWSSWFNDQEATRFMEQGYFPTTKEDQLRHFKNLGQSHSDLQLAIVEKEEGRLCGSVGLHKIDWIHRTGDVSIVIGESFGRGKGIGSEAVHLIVDHAFIKLNLNKLTSGMVASNEGSFQLFEKLGFKEEGRLRDQLYIEGKYQDVVKLGLLASEWRDQ